MLSEFEQKHLDEKLKMARTERYSCQSVARKALPEERVSTCLRIPNNNSNVQVWKHLKTQKAFYNGLLVCGSVWTCPVCSAKISERRRKELQQAFQVHQKEGGKIALLTLTFSHKKTDKLKETIAKFGQATQKFMSGRAYNDIRLELDLIGRIRVFEVTYGLNGFHPHTHIALFYNNDIPLENIKYKMFDLWEKACFKVGLTTSEKYGLDLQDGNEAEKYLSKHGTWGLDQELSKAHIKKAKNESMTPFDFLREYLKSENEFYLTLFKEYAECFKGKRQLQWSQGLKQKFVIEEKTDELLAKESLEDADLLGLLTYDTWKNILKYENRSYFLDLCEKYDFEKALNIVNDYKFNINSFKKNSPYQNDRD